eukprot:11058545-Ditylum_brightwellii.AAC.1
MGQERSSRAPQCAANKMGAGHRGNTPLLFPSGRPHIGSSTQHYHLQTGQCHTRNSGGMSPAAQLCCDAPRCKGALPSQ